MPEIGLFGQTITNKKTNTISVYESLVFFQDTPKTETAFYLRFQVMPLEYLHSLKSYFNTDDEYRVFQEILKYYKIH